MAKQARPAAATVTVTAARPPRASVPAFGGWEVAGSGAAAATPDYSLDFTAIRAERMQRRQKALSWSSFVGNAAVVAEAEAPGGGDEEEKRQWSLAAASDDDDDRERRHRHLHRHHRQCSLRNSDDRQPIRPGRPAPKGRSKFKGYLFGCVAG